MKINWDEKPEWAIGIGYSQKHGDWQWFDHSHYMYYRGGVKFPFNTSFCMDDLVDVQLVCDKTEWNGEGLPPVGTVCEGWLGNGWYECEVLAHKELGTACYFPEFEYYSLKWIERFRPIKSDREKWIENTMESFNKTNGISIKCAIEHIYDAIASGELPIPKQEK